MRLNRKKMKGLKSKRENKKVELKRGDEDEVFNERVKKNCIIKNKICKMTCGTLS